MVLKVRCWLCQALKEFGGELTYVKVINALQLVCYECEDEIAMTLRGERAYKVSE